MDIYLLIPIIFSSILLLASLYYNYRFIRIIFSYEDCLEDCLDALDGSYGKISEVLSIPLYSDSTEIKQVIDEIENSRNAILYVANQIARVEDEEKEV
jgi:hypothetical protein